MLKKAFKAAWPKTIPIMAGFLFLGFSYGVCDENFRLMPNKTAEHTLIYDKNRLARGIDLSQDGADIVLMLNLPTSPLKLKNSMK